MTIPFDDLTPVQVQQYNHLQAEISSLKKELHTLMVMDNDI
jgi:hypothetical protein